MLADLIPTLFCDLWEVGTTCHLYEYIFDFLVEFLYTVYDPLFIHLIIFDNPVQLHALDIMVQTIFKYLGRVFLPV